MVKFAQQLQAELVPEWQEAYCSYGELKADLKRIQQHRIMGPTYNRMASVGLLKSLASMKPSLSGIQRSLSRRGRPEHSFSLSPRGAFKDAIVVNKKQTKDGEIYITELREPLTQSPQDMTFFARLDTQLTKVNKFYKKKEGEYIARAGVLEKQMLALINSQEEMARQGLMPISYLTKKEDRLPELKETSDELPLIPEEKLKSNEYPLQTFPMKPTTREQRISEDEEGEVDSVIQDYIDEVAATNLKQRRANFAETDLELAIPDSRGTGFVAPGQLSTGSQKVQFSPGTPGANLPLTPARSALKKVSQISESKEPEIEAIVLDTDIENQKGQTLMSEKELEQAKNLLRLAFIEFYRGLGLLSNYRSLNISAFAKILKKYDKNTSWNFAPIYMKEVESSYFVTSAKVHKLMNKVEDIFTKQFTEGVRKKAITQLRPTRKQGSHRTTFFIGLFTGCSLALFISFFFLVDHKQALRSGGSTTRAYLENVFPVFSTLMLIILHMFIYAWNVFSWARTRVNYPFIFGFAPGSELRYREVLLLATGFTTILLGGMNLHISVTLLTTKVLAPPPSPPGFAPAPVPAQEGSVADIIPLILVLATLVTLFLPFNLMYRSARAYFLSCFRRLISAPLVKVILPDFFLGDQLTSQVLVFRNLQFIACYYPTGYFLSGADEKCDNSPVFKGFGYVVALLPFWWRFLQCLRRYYDEKDTHQLENAGKYMSAILALGLRQGYSNNKDLTSLWILSIITSIIATIYASYWDFCVDWGLLNSQSKNKWLRDKLILKKKSTYFVAIGTNCVLRLAWMLSILQVDTKLGWNSNAFGVITATLEIFRRGLWNFFRIENEHLNNVGKYRAVKAVPLPFNDD